MAYKVGRCLLQQHLDKAHMMQSELADKLGVPKQQIQNYINGNRIIYLPIAKNIAAILNCTIDDLYEWIEVGNNE
ncbi:MAG TPA: helix-turn-helix transcriptional regulator [Candidatus Nitrosocosmicus sp.]|nr:helix-turn-helix transcriptional regulator [Candidatus Nitrosocosmicus sp.]